MTPREEFEADLFATIHHCEILGTLHRTHNPPELTEIRKESVQEFIEKWGPKNEREMA